jgi:lipid II:glycine glycyltransferase (peptidoglycan interpeptide bridge formation enzyme)
VQHGVTVSVDLTLTEDDLWRQTRRNHRQQIRQALGKGYVAQVADDGQYMEEFKALYRATMTVRAADAYYFFDDDYFAALQAALGPDLHVAVAMKDGVAAAAGMFVVTGDIMQLHLTGHDSRFAADQPMKLVFHAVRSWGQEHGLRVLHLGGGRGGAEDSLLHFKAGFSPWRQPYHTLRVVIDEPAYAELVAARDPALDPSDRSGPFPAYRDA